MQSENKTTTTNQGAISVPDHCTTCPWLDRQPEGNKMLCILPGNCFWREEWRHGTTQSRSVWTTQTSLCQEQEADHVNAENMWDLWQSSRHEIKDA